MYNEIPIYCQWRDIAERDVASSFIFGACISPPRFNDSRSISQLLRCGVGGERSVVRCGRVHICVCVHAHISEVMGFCPVTVAAEHFPIIPCSQPCCSLHVTMDTLVAIHQPITAEQGVLKSCQCSDFLCCLMYAQEVHLFYLVSLSCSAFCFTRDKCPECTERKYNVPHIVE